MSGLLLEFWVISNPFWDSKPELFSDIACLRIPYQPCIVLFRKFCSGTPASNWRELRLHLNVVPTAAEAGVDVTAGPWPVYLWSGQPNWTKMGQLIFSGHLGQQLSLLPCHSISTDNRLMKFPDKTLKFNFDHSPKAINSLITQSACVYLDCYRTLKWKQIKKFLFLVLVAILVLAIHVHVQRKFYFS